MTLRLNTKKDDKAFTNAAKISESEAEKIALEEI